MASPKQWQAIIAAKTGPCRVCGLESYPLDWFRGPHEYHHIVSRAQGGDDVPENIVPLHDVCHGCVTSRLPSALAALAASLTHSETAYLLDKIGEAGIESFFGVAR